MRLAWVLVLGLAYAVDARDCLTSVAMDNFNLQKIAGTWYETGFAAVNETEADEFVKINCIENSYTAHENNFEVVVKYLRNGEANEELGKYKATNNSNAEFTIYYPKRSSHNIYILSFVCTDYNNYMVKYSSLQFEDGHCSEFPIIMVRDRSKYEKLKHNSEMKQCIQEKLGMSVHKFKNMNNVGCQ